MARDHSKKVEKKEEPKYIEQEINLSLINAKLNEVIRLLNLKNSSSSKSTIDEDDDEED